MQGACPGTTHAHLPPSPQTRAPPSLPCVTPRPRVLGTLQSWPCAPASVARITAVKERASQRHGWPHAVLPLRPPHPQRLLFARQRRHLVLLLHLLPQLAEAAQEVAGVPRILRGLHSRRHVAVRAQQLPRQPCNALQQAAMHWVQAVPLVRRSQRTFGLQEHAQLLRSGPAIERCMRTRAASPAARCMRHPPRCGPPPDASVAAAHSAPTRRVAAPQSRSCPACECGARPCSTHSLAPLNAAKSRRVRARPPAHLTADRAYSCPGAGAQRSLGASWTAGRPATAGPHRMVERGGERSLPAQSRASRACPLPSMHRLTTKSLNRRRTSTRRRGASHAVVTRYSKCADVKPGITLSPMRRTGSVTVTWTGCAPPSPR